MKQVLSVVIVSLLCCSLQPQGADAAQVGTVDGAMSVLRRLIPDHAEKFTLKLDEGLLSTNPHHAAALAANPSRPNLPNTTYDTFIVSAKGGRVSITASSAVGLTSGAYWYLKNKTGCLVTWGNNGTGDQLSTIPDQLPDVEETTIHSAVPWRYGWNVCTFSYTATWWDAARWQREIDWMALHGVNMPLAFTGQEYIWVKLFAKFNITLDELQSWFTGPPFMTWQRFGNIRGFTSPLPMSFIEGQKDLQLGILKQMRSLGMTPVLPCFAGHVPEAARKVWPTAKYVNSGDWNNFPNKYSYVLFVDPTDPVYQEIGTMFAKMVIDEFGASGYHNCDTYNEVDPTSTDPAFLANASAAVVKALRGADPNAIWVMQAWLFHSPFWNNHRERVKQYLSGVKNEDMLILDLNSEADVIALAYDQYFGKAWIWNMLLNYGGVRGVYGNMTTISTSPAINFNRQGSTMLGIGFTPEAIENNPAMFELLTDTFWQPEPFDPVPWYRNYATNRYGGHSNQIEAAWNELFAAVYNQPGEPRSEIEMVPNWQAPSFGWKNGNSEKMHKAAVLYIQAADSIPNAAKNGPYQYDLVDFARQATTMFFSDVHRMLDSVAYTNSADSQADVFGGLKTYMLDIIHDLDQLLGTNNNYLLGTWTQGAAEWSAPAKNSTITKNFLYAAKNLITMWGPDSQICDYAAKAWSGLYRTYYYGRWENMLDELIKTRPPYNTNWNQNEYNNMQLGFEQTWDHSSEQFNGTTVGNGADALEIAKRLIKKVTTPLNGTTYKKFSNLTYQGGGYYYGQMWTTNTSQLATICSLIPSCASYTEDGTLRQNPRNSPFFLHSPGNALFIKTSEKQLIKEAEDYEARILEQEKEAAANGIPTPPRPAAHDEKPKYAKSRPYADKWIGLPHYHPARDKSKNNDNNGGSFDPFHGANVH